MEEVKMNKIPHFEKSTKDMIWKIIMKTLRETLEIS